MMRDSSSIRLKPLGPFSHSPSYLLLAEGAGKPDGPRHSPTPSEPSSYGTAIIYNHMSLS